MQYIPPAIWGRADSDVKFWVPFNDDMSTDISVYAHGPGTTTGTVTITGGEMSLNNAAAGTEYISWGPVGSLGRPSASALPWTLEAFFTWTSSSNHTGVGCDLRYTLGPTPSSYYHWYLTYGNTGKVAYESPEFGMQAGPSASNVLAGVGKVHVAMVHPAGTSPVTMRFYVGGVQVFTYAQIAGTSPVNDNGMIEIGKFNALTSVVAKIDDIRLTMRELYTGSSFTPPTSPL